MIFPHELDSPGRLLLARAQNCIEAILNSAIRQAGLLEADEPTLRRHEWDIACTTRELTQVGALRSDDAEVGTMTAAVLAGQGRAVEIAQQAADGRVSALERYAAQVAAADRAHRDWHTALRLAGLNDRYLDLVARTAADELAVTEMAEFTARAAVTAQILTESLRDAINSAEVLALPQAEAS